MKQRLMLLNIVLVVLIGVVISRYRQMIADSQQRGRATFDVRVAPTAVVPVPALTPLAPSAAMNYADVAQKMLFARDRNSNIIYDPQAPPPPPPPLPPLPAFYGLMTGFGEPGIILAERSGMQKTYRAGDQVGVFKLVSFDNSNIVFDWDGQKVERHLDQLAGKDAPAAAPAPAPTSNAPVVAGGATNLAPSTPLGPGAETGGGFHACQPNDSTPSGTVQGGLRKVQTATPFGQSCKWEPVR